ncbi:MAG: hypothetical protein AAF846_21375 [Chloroflexota bacterium]
MANNIESNIALVPYGENLYLNVREGIVEGTDLTPDIVEKACRTLVFQRGIAAMPHPTKRNRVLIAASHSIRDVKLQGINWAVSIKDSGQSAHQYRWRNLGDRYLIAELVQRTLEAYLELETSYWTLDSPHIWYEEAPFDTQQGVRAFRRFTVGAIPLDEEGLGLAVDVSTAFFSKKSLAYYFELGLNESENKKRQQKFDKLTNRQKGQKGTLWYKTQDNEGKCYFVSAPEGVTCANTGQIVARGTSYNSLYHYYQSNYPEFDIKPNARAVKVSFDGYGKASWVAAECLFIRVMNDNLPRSLKQVDKIVSSERRDMLQTFWNDLPGNPLGRIIRGEIQELFWQPSEERVVSMRLPDLLFRGNHRLSGPNSQNTGSYKQYFRTRQQTLYDVGCYSTPPTMPRNIYLAVPTETSAEAVKRLRTDLNDHIKKLTGQQVSLAEPITYKSVDTAIGQLRAKNAEMVIFVLNDDPAAYHKTAFDQKWHIKRITQQVLESKFKRLESKPNQWDSFITMNALGIVTQLNVVPYAVETLGAYDAQLVIDVGYDRRNFALSLLIARQEGEPQFQLYTEVYPKPAHQHDTINPTILRDTICDLFKRAMMWGTPLKSLLILRDGEFRVLKAEKEELHEQRGVLEAVHKLSDDVHLTPDVRVEMADYRKSANRPIRLWTRNDTNTTQTALEGTGVLINANHLVLATTGAATLYQGTPQPIAITADGNCTDLAAAGQSIFISAQLNWSSPKVAQRHSQPVRIVDDELQAHQAQEMRRLG